MFSLTEIKIAVFALVLLGAAAGGAIAAHKIDNGRYQKLVASIAQAHVAALEQAAVDQKALDAVATRAAQEDAATQAMQAASVKRQLAEVQRHVKALDATHHCVTFGLIRVLDAASHGVSAGSLALPTGKSDDTCAPIDAATLARSVVDNYGTARANNRQLDDLIGYERAAKATHDKATSSHAVTK